MRDPSYLTPAEAESYEKRRAAMMGEWPGPESFKDWLARRHPGINLTPMQEAWIDAQERGEQFVWSGGRSSGRSFAAGLYEQFLKESPR